MADRDPIVVACRGCGAQWDVDLDPTQCTCEDMARWYLVARDPNRVSAMCWDGRHHRCTGWLIVSSIRADLSHCASMRCDCAICDHPEVRIDRHLLEDPQPGVSWSSSISMLW